MSGAVVGRQRDFDLSKMKVEVIIASLNLCSTFGAVGGGQVAHTLGRRKTICISAVVFFLGAILMAFTSSFAVIVLGMSVFLRVMSRIE